jgi:hypothetical protein
MRKVAEIMTGLEEVAKGGLFKMVVDETRLLARSGLRRS